MAGRCPGTRGCSTISGRYRFSFEFELSEHEPYGLKDERVRALVVSAMQNGDGSQAGVFSTPLRSFTNLNALVSVVKRDLGKVRQPALIVHPREDDMASLKNAHYLQRHLGGLVDTLVLDNSYHMVTLDQQRHIVAQRAASFVEWLQSARLARREIASMSRGVSGDDSVGRSPQLGEARVMSRSWRDKRTGRAKGFARRPDAG